jgi:hypothetical protein
MHTNVSKMRVLILINTQGLLNETFFSIWIFYEKASQLI